MRAISREAGVGRGLANCGFRFRRALLAGMITSGCERFLGVLEGRFPEAPGF